MTEVTVEVEEESQVNDTPPVVVVDTASGSEDTALLMSIAERLAGIEIRLGNLESATVVAAGNAAEAQSTADAALVIAADATDTADTALELANEVAEVAVATAEETGVSDIVAEVTEGDVIPDVTPRKPHWLFRSREDWRQEIGGN